MARFAARCQGGPLDGEINAPETTPMHGDTEWIAGVCPSGRDALSQIHLYGFDEGLGRWLFIRSKLKTDAEVTK